ncbi:MAG: hypothetical protein A4E53_02530 [Pelotomaculum sp. PtaB.Bin104]|nr:MAG: hypothetical protein A4E53_02530 [Pelotomaculum sp. PtaB.Bin104]
MNEAQQEMQNSGSVSEILSSSIQKEMQENRVTSAELGALWNAYIHESYVHHLFIYFLRHMEDPIIKPVLINLVDATKDSLHLLKSVFIKEGIPIPKGITSEDINPNAPRLFSDNLFIPLLRAMTKVALQFFSIAYTECLRDDMRQFFRDFADRLFMHDQQAAELMQAKGIPVPPPYIPIPKKIDFVKKQNFLAGFFKDKRPLTTLEINSLFFNAQSNALGKALLLGYSQIAKSTEIRQFLKRGKNLSQKYFDNLTGILLEEDITVPPSYDGEVTASTESPFSDKFILFHGNYMVTIGMQNYGMAISMSPRHDLAAMYASMMVEVSSYASDGVKLMIKNEWMEQPPLAPDRDALVRQGNKSPYGDHFN